MVCSLDDEDDIDFFYIVTSQAKRYIDTISIYNLPTNIDRSNERKWFHT